MEVNYSNGGSKAHPNKNLTVVGSGRTSVFNEAVGLRSRSIELDTRRQLDFSHDVLSVALARAIGRGTVDEIVGLVGGCGLEVDGLTTRFVQTSRVGSADGLASTLSARIIVVESGIYGRVARRQHGLCGSASCNDKGENTANEHVDLEKTACVSVVVREPGDVEHSLWSLDRENL
jgi:hypothetical protein